MPIVNGKHFAYTPAGYKAARKAKKKLTSKRNYSSDALKMARSMHG